MIQSIDKVSVNNFSLLDSNTRVVMTDTISSGVTYVGESLTFNADTSQPVWRIYRTYQILPKLFRKEYALSDRLYNQIWDDRANLFTSVIPPFVNQYSIEFDGINDYCQMTNVPALVTAMGSAYSVSMWFKTSNWASGNKNMFSMTSATSITPELLQIGYVNTGKIYAEVRNDANQVLTVIGSTTLNLNQWYHVVVTRSGTTVQIYLNGVGEATGTNAALTGTITCTDGAFGTLRRNSTNTNYHVGKIDETSIYAGAINLATITTLYNGGVPGNLSELVTPPLAWWRMGDLDGFPTITDQIGVNHLFCTNMAANSFTTDVPS